MAIRIVFTFSSFFPCFSIYVLCSYYYISCFAVSHINAILSQKIENSITWQNIFRNREEEKLQMTMRQSWSCKRKIQWKCFHFHDAKYFVMEKNEQKWNAIYLRGDLHLIQNSVVCPNINNGKRRTNHEYFRRRNKISYEYVLFSTMDEFNSKPRLKLKLHFVSSGILAGYFRCLCRWSNSGQRRFELLFLFLRFV